MSDKTSLDILLKSTSTMSLHDRFTIMLTKQESEMKAATETLGLASMKNRRLAQQMASWPSVLAALHNKPSEESSRQAGSAHKAENALNEWNNQTLETTERKRITTHSRLQDSESELEDLEDNWSPMQQENGVHINREMKNKGVRCALRGRDSSLSFAARGGFIGRYWTGRRGRAGGRPVPTREELDKQLDEYMSMSKSQLDAQLDAYMAEVDPLDV